MSLPAMSFGDRGRYLQGADSMAMSVLGCRNALVGTRRGVSVFFGIYGLRKQAILPCRDSISSIQGTFLAFLESLECSLVGRCS